MSTSSAGDNAVRFQPHVVGDLLGHILVVAGHDDHRDAILLERFENGRNPLLGRVKEGRETGQRHVLFGRHRVGVLLVHLPNGDPQSAEPVGAQLLEGLRGLSSPAFVERLGRPIDGHRLADGEDTLGLALGDQKAFVAMPHHHGKALAVKVEGDLIQLLVFHDQRALVLQNRGVQRTLDARLKEAVQVDEPQDAIVVLPLDVHVPVELDLAFGQCAGLIAAQDLNASEVLDCGKLLDQDFLLRHPPGSLGQRDRDDHRHHLRRHSHGERDGEEEGLKDRAVESNIHQQDKKHQQHDHSGDHEPEVPYAAAKLGLGRPHGQPLGDLAEGGISARASNDRSADSRLDGGAHENAVARVRNSVFPCRQIAARLLDAQRLARERRLAHLQVFDLQQTGIRRHKVPGIEPDDVPGHQFRDRHFLLSPVAHHGSSGCNLLPNLLHRMLSLKLHEEVQQHAEQDHRDDDQSADRVAQRERYAAGHEKDDDQGIDQKAEKTDQSREARFPHHAVRAVETQPPLRLVGSQPGRSRLEQFQQLRPRLVPEALKRRGLFVRAHCALSGQ